MVKDSRNIEAPLLMLSLCFGIGSGEKQKQNGDLGRGLADSIAGFPESGEQGSVITVRYDTLSSTHSSLTCTSRCYAFGRIQVFSFDSRGHGICDLSARTKPGIIPPSGNYYPPIVLVLGGESDSGKCTGPFLGSCGEFGSSLQGVCEDVLFDGPLQISVVHYGQNGGGMV